MSVEGNSAPILPLKKYLAGHDLLPSLDNRGHEKLPDRLLVVPPWQREYVWSPSETGEVGILLEDLRDFVHGPEEDYLMGSVLLSHGSKFNERLIIDGQQRTLTYSLLIMAVLKHVQNQRELVHHLGTPEENSAEDRVLVEMRSAVSADDSMYIPRVSMPHSKANDMLQSIFAWSKVADGEASNVFTEEKEHWTQTQRNLIDVASWIYEKQLKTESWLPNKSLLRAMRKIMSGVKFLQVTLTGQQEAISIFDRINSRGALLDSGDLIKNRIFQSVEDDEDFEIISNSWLEMNESLAKCSVKRMREPKFLLRAIALSDQNVKALATKDDNEPETKFSAPKITYEKLTTYWGDRLDPKKSNNDPLEKKLGPFEFATTLVEAGSWLQAFSVETTPANKNLPELYFSRYLNSVQHYPMLIAARSLKDHDVLRYLTKQVHARTAFYLLSEERTQDYESLVPTWTALIAKAGQNATKETLKEIYEDYVKVGDESMDSLMNQMRNWSYTSTDKKKIRAVLSQLTRLVDIAGGKEDKDSPVSYFSTRKDANQESWDIDHILPKKTNPKDPELHKIGNLVLLKAKHNSLKQAESPGKKSDVYSGSHLLLTQNLVSITVNSERSKVENYFKQAGVEDTSWNLSSWDQESMKKRSDMYCSLLRHHLTNLD
jgi:hypothetical protein